MIEITRVGIQWYPGDVHVGASEGKTVIRDDADFIPVVFVCTPGSPGAERLNLGGLQLVRGCQGLYLLGERNHFSNHFVLPGVNLIRILKLFSLTFLEFDLDFADPLKHIMTQS